MPLRAQDSLTEKDTTANLTNFYTQLNFWQQPKTWLTKTPNNQKPTLTNRNEIDSKTCWLNENHILPERQMTKSQLWKIKTNLFQRLADQMKATIHQNDWPKKLSRFQKPTKLTVNIAEEKNLRQTDLTKRKADWLKAKVNQNLDQRQKRKLKRQN